MNVGARPSMLKGELVSKNRREEPVSFAMQCRAHHCKSLSFCVEGRARQ